MARSYQTKLLLAQSLQELLQSMSLEKISVNDIVEHAGVGRNTFYYHFADKYDLVNWYFQSGATKILLERASFSDWNSMLCAIEAYFRENRVFYTKALEYTGQNCLQEYIFEFISSIYVQRARDAMPAMPEEDLSVLGHFMGGAFMGVLLPWVRGGMKEHPKEPYAWLRSITSGELSKLILNASPAPDDKKSTAG